MRALRVLAPLLVFLGFGLLEGIHVWIGYHVAGGFSSGIILRGQSMTLPEVYARVLPSWTMIGVLAIGVAALTRRFPLASSRWPRAVALHIAGALVFSSIAVLGNVTFRWLFFVQPEIGTVTWGSTLARYYALYFNTLFVDYWGVVAVYSAFSFHRGMREREVAAERLARGLSEARLAALQAQLQPHFLFNTLNAIASLAESGEHAATVRSISLLSSLLRTTLSNPGQVSTVGDDLQFARRYLDLQRIRFPDRMHVDLTCDPDVLSAEIPALLLHTLIENAVRYGITQNPDGGTIDVRIERAGPHVRVVVQNSLPVKGRGRPRGPDGGLGIGLASARARLEQLYGADFKFEISTTGKDWTVAVEWPVRLRLRRPVRPASPQAARSAAAPA